MKINKHEAKKNHVFASKDKTKVFSNILFLGVNDSIDNYIEVSVEEAKEIREAQRKLKSNNLHVESIGVE